MLSVKIHKSIAEISRIDWNALIEDNNPLLRHEFLHGMELHQCVGEKFGWLPCHIALYDDHQLVGAIPLYIKTNNYGEFVFDHSWADAYSRNGMDYYPKLVSAVPYTPAQGQRLLCQRQDRSAILPVLFKTLQELTHANDFSGFHFLFAADEDQDFLENHNLLIRHDCQYHWFNKNYQNFSEFLATLVSRKRKNIRKERQAVVNAGVTLRRLNGHTANSKDWQDFTLFYNRTFEEKWGMATFNQAFFEHVAKHLPDNILLVLADNADGQCIAGSLMYVSDNTLYGRHWGCTEQIDHLHFEACYYQGIEFCIEQGLSKFEPGAQGEHKIARGFIPVRTRSAHYLQQTPLYSPIADFCQRERRGVADYMQQLQAKIPFK